MLPTRSRWSPLWVSLGFAAFFILLRVGYRLIFGSVSWEAVVGAIELALPFAAVIVVCGVLTSLIDPRRFLLAVPLMKYGKSIGTALAIGLSTFPLLISMTSRVKKARVLRGDSSRFSFFIPVLENVVEKSLALAASLDTKGFGAPQHQATEPARIEFRDYSCSFGNTTVLENITLDIEPCEIVVLTGATGSGKTTFLESIVGLSTHFHHAEALGQLTIAGLDRRALAPRHTSSLVGWVPQNVRDSFLSATPRTELITRLRLAEIQSDENTISDALQHYGLSDFADNTLDTLSAGQARRVALASALITHPAIVVLDEPTAELDSTSVELLVDTLSELSREGVTVVIAEHHTAALERLRPRFLHINDGQILEGRHVDALFAPARTVPVVGSELVLTTQNLTFAHSEHTGIFDISLTANQGEIVCITGANGAGKSTLLHQLAQPAATNTVMVRGKNISTLRPVQRAPFVALIPENVSDLFVTDTVFEECVRADTLAGIPAGTALTQLTFFSLLERHHGPAFTGEQILSTHPRDLSAGTQLALAIAVQSSWKPAVLLVDEPSRGLDPQARLNAAEVLACVAETGTAVMCATHDTDFAEQISHRILRLNDGRITSVEVMQP